MKNFSLLLAASFITMLAGVGCGGGSKVDTAPFEQAFQSAPAAVKSEITKSVSAIKGGDLAKAADSIKAAIKAGELSQEQKDAISNIAAEIQKIASQDPDKYPLQVYNSISEIAPMLEGQRPVMGNPQRPQ